MQAPCFDGYPAAHLDRAERVRRQLQWQTLEDWLRDGPVADTDAWLAAHPDYHGPSTSISSYHLRKAGRLVQRVGTESAADWLRDAELARPLHVAPTPSVGVAPHIVMPLVSAMVSVPVVGVCSGAAYMYGGPHAAGAAAVLVGGLALLRALWRAVDPMG